jgi:D-3-phosphoglycerate dehydrogenase
MKVLVSTAPFSEIDTRPIEILRSLPVSVQLNPYGRKLLEDELKDLISDVDILIAGTEPITRKVLNAAKNLKLISRVGVGIDSVDLVCAMEKNIKVSYTPEAPAPAVADLTSGLMFSLARSICTTNTLMHKSIWKRTSGFRLVDATVGIIGCGRIGSMVIDFLVAIGVKKILINDLDLNNININKPNVIYCEKDYIFKNSDILSLHLPLNNSTRYLINANVLKMMKSSSYLVNTSRGGIVDEVALFNALKSNEICGAAVDVFEMEPYSGPLSILDNCILTSHMGSMTFDCRGKMELEATEEAARFINGIPLLSAVPPYQYLNH